MGRYRKIDPRMWGDEKFKALSKPQPNAQTLWQYLLTGPHTNSCPGLFNIGEAALAENLGWPLEQFRKRFKELLDKEMVKADFVARVIFIPRAIFYDPPDNPNVVKHWSKMYDEIPECKLKSEFYHIFKQYVEGLCKQLDERSRERFIKAFTEGFKDSIPFLNHSLTIPKEETPASPTVTDLQPNELIFIFNDNVQYLPKISQTKSRLDKIRTRLKEHRESDWWIKVFKKADLVLIPGKDGKKDWFPTFDWLIENDKNAVKVFEGNYEDAKRPKKIDGDYRPAEKVLEEQGMGKEIGASWKNENK